MLGFALAPGNRLVRAVGGLCCVGLFVCLFVCFCSLIQIRSSDALKFRFTFACGLDYMRSTVHIQIQPVFRLMQIQMCIHIQIHR